MKKLIVSPSPHDENFLSATRIMLKVITALLPAWFAGLYIFGARCISLTAVCIGSCILFEYLCRLLMGRNNTVGDLSAVVTGMLLAMNLPVTLPYWMAVTGSFIAIAIVKQLFGGLGQNFANPAITARIVLMISFPASMTHWIKPFEFDYDAVSSATPLALEKAGEGLPTYAELFFGKTGGCLGETCALALLAGGIYLMVTKIISPAAPLAFIGSLFIFSWLANEDPIYQILSGGVFLGAFFMATDYATTPITAKGKVVFGLGCGILTFVIRRFGAYPEGVSFSILIMNVLTPYIEEITRNKAFGAKEVRKDEG